MNIKKSLLLAGAVVAVGGTSVAGLGVASAMTDSNQGQSLAGKIATKFNLDKSEVEAVFEEEKTERNAEHEQKVEERLTQAVADGKLTEDQKAKILAKHAELKAQMEADHEALKDKTKDEMRALMEQRREDLQAWAEENNIPEQYMPFMFGGPGEQGREHMVKLEHTNPANE